MAAVTLQPELVLDPHAAAREKEERDEADHDLFYRLMAAFRAVTRDLTNDRAANELAAMWAPHGRDVSPATLRATLAPGNERNYFRVEWIIWFARQSEDVAHLLMEIAGHGLPRKSTVDELEDLRAIVRREYPRQADKHLREASSPRRPRR